MYKSYVLLIHFFRAYGALFFANLGDNVTLPCLYDSNAKNLCWYKQVAGEQPQIMSSFYKHLDNSNVFHDEFKDNKRFSIHTGQGFYHLNICNVQHSDSAMYYCGHTSVTITTFKKGTLLVVKDSNCWSFLQQPASDSVQPGGSVTLNCTVHTGTSDGEHSVYWFKKDTENSHLGIMYIHTHNSSECVNGTVSGSPARSCVYNLSKRRVTQSDAGTYYCAVALCGQILFGKGTKLDVGVEQCDTPSVLLLCVVAALVVSLILNIVLFSVICKRTRGTYLQSGGSHPQPVAPEYTADTQNKESDALQYVALDFKKRQGKSRRQRSTKEEAIYSRIRTINVE
ncbi:uncharacterized protein LOC121177242 [Toxotes jaculatrix]|uniref:uncharacterized protein LOC121177242 n=1 Tax=Toxotes jaculatrix TaxID=941984 RepID=UPI001B3AA2BE|nr:uncharacterized protein LOC121177242 [Toxotes jaculatrix]